MRLPRSRHALVLCAGILVASLAGAQQPARCSESALYAKLDFWVGEWEVYVGEDLVGHNRIEKTLDGCAIFEHWTAVDGGEGKSLFFVDYDRHWAQIWVTQWAMSPGGVKEKVMVDDPPEGSVRFQGVIRHVEAGSWMDRTTLTPQEDGSVRQLIEISEDGGQSWNPTFDANYRPKRR
jgi:hypothetical protein